MLFFDDVVLVVVCNVVDVIIMLSFLDCIGYLLRVVP